MLHILLYIVKTIGTILISILGILLILSVTILVVPIRYQIEANKYENLEGDVRIRWILNIIYLRITYEKEKIKYQFRIFGFAVKDNDRPEKKGYKKKKVKKPGKKKNKYSQNSHLIEEQNNLTKNDGRVKKSRNPVKGPGENSYEAESKFISQDKLPYKKTQENNREAGNIRKDNAKDSQEIYDLGNRKLPFWEKLRNIIHISFTKIKKILSNIFSFFKNLRLRIIKINFTRKTLIQRCNLILTFFKEEENKEGIKKIWMTIKKSVKHIFPRRIKGYVHFGTGDPCSTGQLLGIISLTYHYYQNVKIVPDFNEEILEGNVNVKGRIQLFTLAIICIKLLLDKNFKKLLKNYQKLKEEL